MLVGHMQGQAKKLIWFGLRIRHNINTGSTGGKCQFRLMFEARIKETKWCKVSSINSKIKWHLSDSALLPEHVAWEF